MGNSIARQFLFNTVEVLGGEAVDRENQKLHCPKLEINWDANSCRKEYKGVQFKYLFFRYMDGFYYKDRGGFPFMKNLNTYNTSALKLPDHPNDVVPPVYHILTDNCINEDTRTCMKNFFHDSKKEDVLIFSLGFAYCEQESDNLDYDAWCRASATAFRSNLQEVFPGTVFRVNNPEVHAFKSFPQIDSCLRKMDHYLWEIWHPSSFPEGKAWYHIDQFNINKNRPELYNDGLHFIGPLSKATIQQVLNSLCPSEGIPIKIKPAPEYRLSLVSVQAANNSKIIESYYLVDEQGSFFQLPQPAGLCPKILKREKDVTLTAQQFQSLSPPILKFPDICGNETLARIGRGREVFGLFDSGWQLFNSFHAFASRGYDFGNVKTLNEREFNFFPVGPVVN